MKHTETHSWDETKFATADCVASFRIWPHRSLDRRGTLTLLAFVMVAGTVVFLGSPARAVLPLAVGPFLAGGALSLALWCNNRAARFGEVVEIGPQIVKVTRLGTRGPIGSTQFATGWVRVTMRQDRRIANRLVLTQSGRSCSIAEYLSPGERKCLAQALSATVDTARRGAGALSQRKADDVARG